ncbi:hypothetical protein [Nocardioides mangrovi]|uniref:Uncharacterized protein n=1 Tax=Nocardioides mangrovi TaxID=2874580 RepID=A0ABS7U7K5_9ACTN|nr:hypothetical protein [Nocardioides mangrovi]MBZ5736969.1 hypothetical protein [Nocardioides mangrovi]
MPARPRLVSRRTTLAVAGAGLVVLAGCDDRDEPAGDPTTSPSADPDQALVDEVVEQQGRAWQRATKAGAADLAALHAAHLEALGAPTPTSGQAPRIPVRRVEQQLQSALVAASLTARSGDLARLLASMSAAVSQQLEVR